MRKKSSSKKNSQDFCCGPDTINVSIFDMMTHHVLGLLEGAAWIIMILAPEGWATEQEHVNLLTKFIEEKLKLHQDCRENTELLIEKLSMGCAMPPDTDNLSEEIKQSIAIDKEHEKAKALAKKALEAILNKYFS